MSRPSLSLVAIAGCCAILLVLTQWQTGERIDQNTRAHELRLITELAGMTPPASRTWSADVWDLCNETVLTRVTVPGYGGPIAMITAFALGPTEGPTEERVQGLRIVSHQETPGLADFIDQHQRGWMARLTIQNAPEIADVDVVVGATITSRAVQRGVLRALSQARDRPAGACGP